MRRHGEFYRKAIAALSCRVRTFEWFQATIADMDRYAEVTIPLDAARNGIPVAWIAGMYEGAAAEAWSVQDVPQLCQAEERIRLGANQVDSFLTIIRRVPQVRPARRHQRDSSPGTNL